MVKSYNWRTLPSKVHYKVEAGKKYRIKIHFAQLHNWQANIEFNFGKEKDVDFTEVEQKIDKLKFYLEKIEKIKYYYLTF